jgi:hypothetical protein
LKKYFALLCLFILMSIVGCSAEDESAGLVKKFINEYYTIEDYSKISTDLTSDNVAYNKNVFPEKLQEMLSLEIRERDIENRNRIRIISSSVKGKFNISVDSIEIEKSREEEDLIVYDYTAILKLKSSNAANTKDICGQLTVKKVNKKWAIDFLNKVDTSFIEN